MPNWGMEKAVFQTFLLITRYLTNQRFLFYRQPICLLSLLLTPLLQERANLPVKPFFLIFHQFLEVVEKNDISLSS